VPAAVGFGAATAPAASDDGTGTAPTAPAPGHGYGLIGMRERALSVGGGLRAGHRSEGGFEVTTTLPRHPLRAVTGSPSQQPD
jgi:nitrate/nitrite-specific signal transduction histidine kinase